MRVAGYAERALETLRAHGHEAYIVGGAVRDLLRGVAPSDYDIATDAAPDEVKRCFEKTVPTGEKHGTVTVFVGNHPLEVTTFRVDAGYSDSRHPDSVRFTRSITEDLARRDFTVNAMAFDGETVVDPFGGRDDLARRVIRAVGDPAVRFREDALRILRAFRFASALSFEIEGKTLGAALSLARTLPLVSRERIYAELRKTLLGERPDALDPLLAAGGLTFLGLPRGGLSPLRETDNTLELRLAGFCFLCGGEPDAVLRELRAPNRVRELAAGIYGTLRAAPPRSKADIKRLLRDIPPALWEPVIAARGPLLGEDAAALAEEAGGILKRGEPYLPSMLPVNGDDVTRLGAEGKRVGETLEFLLQRAVDDPSLSREDLLALAKRHLGG